MVDDGDTIYFPPTINGPALMPFITQEQHDRALERIAWCEQRIETLNAVLRNTVEMFGLQYTGEEGE